MKRRKVPIKQASQRVEINQRRIFVGFEKGAVKNENNALLTMSNDRTYKG